MDTPEERRGKGFRFPFFKDEPAINLTHVPSVSTAVAVRLFIITVVIGFVLMGAGGFYLLKLQNNYQNSISEGRKSRLADQARTDNEIRELACLAVSLSPPGRSVITDKLRALYNCPPYQKGGTPTLPAYPSASPSSTVHAPSGLLVPSIIAPAVSLSVVGPNTPVPTASRSN